MAMLVTDRAGLSLLRIYSLTAETLYYKYEAFVLARPSGLRVKMETLSMESLKEFREQIKRDQTAAHIAAQGAAASADGGNVGGSSRKAKAGVGLDLGGL
jgi:DNA polymerase alpha subunit B